MTGMNMSGDPQSGLAGIAGAAVDTAMQHPDGDPGDQVAVLLRKRVPAGWENGVCMEGFSDTDELADALLMFVRAVCEETGRHFEIITIPQN